MKGLSKGRYDETFAGEDGCKLTEPIYTGKKIGCLKLVLHIEYIVLY